MVGGLVLDPDSHLSITLTNSRVVVEETTSSRRYLFVHIDPFVTLTLRQLVFDDTDVVGLPTEFSSRYLDLD